MKLDKKNEKVAQEFVINQSCFILIHLCRKHNSKILKIKHENVRFNDEVIGDWEIVVKKIRAKSKKK